MKKILVFRNDRLGEFLLIIPALRALKKTFKCNLAVVSNPYLQDLAHCIPEVDEVFSWEMKKHKLKDIFAFSHFLRQKKFNTAVIINPTKEAHLLSFLARIPVRVGYDRKWGFLLNRKIPDKKDREVKHEVEYNLELVSLIGAKTEDKSLKIEIPPDKLREAREMLRREGIFNSYIVIHPFASYPPKQWPLEKFLQLMQVLSKDWNLVLIGGEENRGFSEKFHNLMFKKQFANLVGKTDLLQLAGILKEAVCLISNDSGPIHLASCVGTRCVALFSDAYPARSPLRWRPWGEGHIVVQKPDIKEITVEGVLAAFEKNIGGLTSGV